MAVIAPTSKIETPEVLMNRWFYEIKKTLDRVEQIKKDSYIGPVKVEWLDYAPIDTQAREYQREKVADLKWKQSLMVSVIEKVTGIDITILNMIHIRIKYINGKLTFELIDGQQRITTILDFKNNIYPLGDNFFVGDLDLSGLFFKDLQSKGGEYKEIADQILGFEITTAFYEGLSDQETSDYFVYKLNNVLDMNYQEKRNAILGGLSRWIRNTSRIEGEKHDIFTTIQEDDGDKRLKYFRVGKRTSKISQRMDRDLWLANLTYLAMNGWRNGISSQQKVTDFYTKTQTAEGKYKQTFTDEKIIKTLLNLGLDICKSTPDMFKSKLNSMGLTMMIFYARELQKSYGKINIDLFVTEWFKLATDWSNTKKALYKDLFEANGTTPMKPFWNNFNGINSNAINTIYNVVSQNLPNVGIKIDTRDFTAKQIDDALIAQGGVDAVTGRTLKREDAVGDHIIPRSEGIENGGVTEPHNLQAISRYNNSTKSNMNDKAFRNQMKSVA